MRSILVSLFTLCLLFSVEKGQACSVMYYVDQQTGKIYVVNHEDYWYDTKAYIRIEPGKKEQLARLWYGWDHFAQGGINQAGLFFDGAVTPEQQIPEGYGKPKGNLGDDILANCRNIQEALALLEEKKIALTNAHMMLGDSSGNAVVVEWVAGKEKIVPVEDGKLIMTNFLLSDTSAGNYPCHRYQAMVRNLQELEDSGGAIDLLSIGNTSNQSVQPPAEFEGKTGGTLYSTFMNISDMKLVLVYKLDNQKVMQFDLKQEFDKGKRRKIRLK